ncbi:NRDE family protein [Chitinophaga pendula]|uniref:NRDE family protein n=1 Tax=Chitinophaga TaxID=79328 RepID=UPI000BB0B40C|nr:MULTISPECIES: NRDE family protein [Chitinophaga]ASZ11946.1 hypothetical protein CK934_13750 [Chitinophaga sp. MD30]UCJ05026.1 NRDE family protein [Chitinophaga pendula]
MCTVTFIPTPNGIYLTANRDEKKERGQALPPQEHCRKGHQMVYPKDTDAGGTWILLKNKRDAAVLMNGAFENHQRQPSYRESRGVIMLQLLETDEPDNAFHQADLTDIEPFTLILFIGGKLLEARWDSKRKYVKQLNATRPNIWSSATLYDALTAVERKKWFHCWLLETPEPDMADILYFHQHAGNGDIRNNLVMDRDQRMYTVSITTILVAKDQSWIRYKDLQGNTDFQKKFNALAPSSANNKGWQRYYDTMKIWRVRTKYWEYWPAALIYAPVFLYWCWLSLKAKSFFFFNTANPRIRYAGFVQERKSDIYKLIPDQYYPVSVYCEPDTTIISIMQLMKDNGLQFPVIAKPDIGERGVQVKLVKSLTELTAYNRKNRVPFLIQEFINYEQEVGIFYYRLPGAKTGNISGIVEKQFLTVTGDGISAVIDLLKKDSRSLLQLQALQFSHGEMLYAVLPAGQQLQLVPYGNHSRGAKFIDRSDKISPQLTAVIDQICTQIPDFYYGRLDIRFTNWTELLEGRNFSIIELNGAGSEPTHIYDPGHSIFYAWKEICRHWKLLYEISKENAVRYKLPAMSFAAGIRMLRDHKQYLRSLVQV